MQAYQFSAKVTPDGKLTIPKIYMQSLAAGHTVQVIVLIPETPLPQDDFDLQDAHDLSLEELVAQIQQTPPNPATIELASGSLADLNDYLANVPPDCDPDFDVATWNETWDKLEAEMKQSSLAHEEEERNLIQLTMDN